MIRVVGQLPDCVGPVAVSEPWGKGETKLILHPSLRTPQLAFPTRSHLGFSFPFVSICLLIPC